MPAEVNAHGLRESVAKDVDDHGNQDGVLGVSGQLVFAPLVAVGVQAQDDEVAGDHLGDDPGQGVGPVLRPVIRSEREHAHGGAPPRGFDLQVKVAKLKPHGPAHHPHARRVLLPFRRRPREVERERCQIGDDVTDLARVAHVPTARHHEQPHRRQDRPEHGRLHADLPPKMPRERRVRDHAVVDCADDVAQGPMEMPPRVGVGVR